MIIELKAKAQLKQLNSTINRNQQDESRRSEDSMRNKDMYRHMVDTVLDFMCGDKVGEK